MAKAEAGERGGAKDGEGPRTPPGSEEKGSKANV